MSLIAPSELLAAYERIAAKESSPAPAAGFKYTARTKAQWLRRSTQRRGLPLPVEAPSVIPSVEISENAPEEIESDDDGVTPKKKISGSTLCLCGCRRDLHCLGDPVMHWPASEGAFGYFLCLAEHCTAMKLVAGKHVDCDCSYFRVAESDAPKLKCPKGNDFTPCANPACGHWRSHHCKVRRPSKSKKPKPRDWEGFADEHGVPHLCQHAPEDTTRNWRCTSTSCAEVSADEKTFCSCERYVNPLAKPKAKAATPRKSRTI